MNRGLASLSGVIVCAIAGLAGCGRDGDTGKVGLRFIDNLRHERWSEACDLLTPVRPRRVCVRDLRHLDEDQRITSFANGTDEGRFNRDQTLFAFRASEGVETSFAVVRKGGEDRIEITMTTLPPAPPPPTP